jgi:hypothetical protein
MRSPRPDLQQSARQGSSQDRVRDPESFSVLHEEPAFSETFISHLLARTIPRARRRNTPVKPKLAGVLKYAAALTGLWFRTARWTF